MSDRRVHDRRPLNADRRSSVRDPLNLERRAEVETVCGSCRDFCAHLLLTVVNCSLGPATESYNLSTLAVYRIYQAFADHLAGQS